MTHYEQLLFRVLLRRADRILDFGPGICKITGCRSARAPGRKRCRPCLDANAAGQRKRGKLLLAAGLCVTCGKRPYRPGKKCCVHCVSMTLARYHDRPSRPSPRY